MSLASDETKCMNSVQQLSINSLKMKSYRIYKFINRSGFFTFTMVDSNTVLLHSMIHESNLKNKEHLHTVSYYYFFEM